MTADLTGEAVTESRSVHDALMTALELMSEGATLASEDGIIRFANPAQERLFGYGPGELVGKHVAVLNAYSTNENARMVQAVLDALERTGAWSGEWVNQRKDGSVFVSVSDIRTVEWRGQRHLMCLQREINTARAPLEARFPNEERLTMAAEAARLGIWEWDLASNTFAYSARARAICGFSTSGVITYDDVVRVTHPGDLPHTLAQAERALDPAIRDRTPYEYRIVRPDGNIRWVRAYGYAVFSDGDSTPIALRYIGTLEDITERIEARDSEAEATRQVRLALESARMAVWSVNLQNQVLKSSPEFNQLFGFETDAQPTLQDVETRYAPGAAAEMNARWSKAVESGARTFEHEVWIALPDQERCLQIRCDVRYLEDGQPERAIGIVMDITEQKRAKDALSESDARFREAADSAPAPVWMTNSDGKVEFGNRAMAEFAGLPVGDVMGDVWLSRIHPDDLQSVVDLRSRAWAEGYAPYTFEARFRRADGAWRWLEVNSRARRDAVGRFKGYVGLAVDRTDARELLAKVSESEERFRLLADSAPVMIWMSKKDGSCLYLNAALRRFWNVENENVSAFDWRTMMHPEDEARITADVVGATRARASFTTEGRYRDANGAYRIVRTEGVPRYSVSGEFVGMIGVNVDLTDLIDAQEHQRLLLEELNHRVKNTLAVVQSLAKQTFRSGVDVSVARGIFDERLRALAGAHTLLTRSNWENAELRGVLDQATQVCGETRKRIRSSGADILLNPKQALSVAMALHELCTNAVKHGALSGDAGAIDLTWEQRDGRIDLEWSERDGPLVRVPDRKGFGSTLLERVLPKDINGHGALSFAPDGVTYTLSFPVDFG